MREILLTRGYVALVDDEDFDRVDQFKWHALVQSHTVYAVRGIHDERGCATKVRMHRVILNAPSDLKVDHVDGDGLNNTRGNLRLATHRENMRNQRIRSTNRSGFTGVHLDRGRWRARIQHRTGDSKGTLWNQLFDDPVEAARARDRKAIELHGEFAFLNFPIEDYQ